MEEKNMNAIEFLKSEDPNFSLLTDTNQSYSLQEWIDLMEEYAKYKRTGIVGASVSAFMPKQSDRYEDLAKRYLELLEMHKEQRKVLVELCNLAVTAQKTPPCDFHTEKSKQQVARINEIARMIELYK